ncbi:MAG: DegT/DnrJ/EryC1/StrS family aminotransferase [Sphingobacteriales bacterium]|jgi:dTDP-4-amino-4,6-dideoxygalactose transaminase|nr:MAG: DegT/DnrJ/EryC1/StrS family aminotransferase [Sphingobacteriales bacterium]
MATIPFFDLQLQYQSLKKEIDDAISSTCASGKFIGGEAVHQFEQELASYLGIQHVVSCGNGTDALMLALLSANLPKNSSIIIPTFNYIAAVEVATLLGYNIIFADVCNDTFNINLEKIKAVLTNEVKAIIVTHLFGQIVEDIDEIATFCNENGILLIEDAAQCIGAEKNITRNSIITTSFFPTKNLACYGDGGAVMTNNNYVAEKLRKLTNHGQNKKYYHEYVGINSRLDAIQAKILSIKLKHLDTFIQKRKHISSIYDEALKNIDNVIIPKQKNAHAYHQYTIKVKNNERDSLQDYLKNEQIETVVYYPLCAHQQVAYKQNISLKNAEQLCQQVLSLPIFPELEIDNVQYIIQKILSFYN